MDSFFLFPIDEDDFVSDTSSFNETDKAHSKCGISHEEGSCDDEVFATRPGETFTTTATSTRVSHRRSGISNVRSQTTAHRKMKPPSSPTLPPPVGSSSGAFPNRGRRWSLDVISPLRLLVTPHGSASTGRRPSAPDDQTGSGDDSSPGPTPPAVAAPSIHHGGRRYSQPIIPKVKPIKDKRVKVKDLAGKKGGKSGQHKAKESYVLATLDTGQTVVLTCKDDDRHLKQLLSVAMMDRRVLSYRMIVASSRGVLKGGHSAMGGLNGRKVRSCENLLEVLSEPDDEWEREEALRVMPEIMSSCRRREILKEMARTDRQYYDNLQAVFDSYAEPLR
ncbi:hypothetical protein EGW08_000239 [Elysia chlorotica]|uniref:DH domain-containing protein n=1 Tax=Elysia chlorotica TaxID=188477 RepID=A0A3S1BVA2_ELYCH|nr:hypothetical protein EGW08_000239 [Elysia chlorotica]